MFKHIKNIVYLHGNQKSKQEIKMAVLKIYSDIATQEEKVWYQWYGLDAVCYQDIEKFCEGIPEDDNEIDIRLYCNGGSCMEGWAIYDKLRQSGKDITVTVEGKAASMATVIMMAAEKKKRMCYQNASICVHNPWMDGYYLGQCTADDLQKAADNLREEQNRIRDLYVERCGCGKKEIQDLMDEDKYINPERAKELGLIGKILQPISASARAYRNKEEFFNSKIDMKQDKTEQTEVSKSWLEKVLAFFGKEKPEDVRFDLTLNTANGEQITVERESGNPQVGDKAKPDGAWLMPEGETIVIENGKITEIREEQQGNAAAQAAVSDGEGTRDPTDGRIAELEASVAQLTAERDALQAQLADVQSQLTEAQAHARTKEEERVINAVLKAGGVEALEQWQSQYQPALRTPQTKKAQEQAMSRDETKNAIMEKIAAFNKKKK